MTTRRIAWVLLALLLLAAQLLLATPLFAQATREAAPVQVHLSYQRDPGTAHCPSARELTLGVEGRLRRRVFAAADGADLFVSIRTFREKRRYVALMTLFDSDRHWLGERRLETGARHCSALADSLILVLSLAADVRRYAAEPEPLVAATSAHSTPLPSRRELSTPLDIPEPAPLPSGGLELQLSLGPAVALGLLPAAALGAQSRLALLLPRFWPLWVDATLWHAQRLGREQGVRFTLQTVRVGVCPWSAHFGRLRLLLCAEEAFGAMRARGFGFDEDVASSHWWAALGASTAAQLPLGPLFVSLSGSGLAPFVQRRYFYADGDTVTVYREPRLLGVTTLSVGLDL
jgi:hypothetical protein